MTGKVKDEILYDHNHDGIDRRGFLKCMAWAGTGALCVMSGGVLKSYSLSLLPELNPKEAMGELSFVQISDSHMGFNKPANPDVAGTLKAAVDKINALSAAPEFMLHTGDISHLSKPEEFDTVDQILKSAKPRRKAVPRALWKRQQRLRLVQFRQERRALHWAGQRHEFESRGARNAGPRTARMAGRRREAPETQHPHRSIRAHSALVGLSGVGLGYGR